MVLTPLPVHKTETREKVGIKENTEVKKELKENREKVKETQDAKA